MIFFVIGVESSGTRLATQLLRSMGLIGQCGHEQSVDAWINDLGNMDNRAAWQKYARDNNIVVRRSIPHACSIPDFKDILAGIEDVSYPVFTIRSTPTTLESMIDSGHASSYDTALAKIREGQRCMARFLAQWEGPFSFISYGGLVLHTKASIECLYEQMKSFCPSLNYPTFQDIRPEAENTRSEAFLSHSENYFLDSRARTRVVY